VTPDEVKSLVDDEIRRGWDGEDPRANPHGVQLRRCLLTQPERRVYLNSFNNHYPVEMWLVLEEDPDGHSGYEIVCDEARSEFGLAVPGKEHAVFIGYYGSFRETLAGM
jgi:hypothetical protein